ncbi:MAG TPA: ribonuclease III [Candidatus Hydrogenedentes bacterium]|nr:ribonuclease III [Candidatus Hydrogenedentota bacterium]
MDNTGQAEDLAHRNTRLERFAARLGGKVKNVKLWEDALTHASWTGDTGSRGGHNEALEFLGDAVLGLVVAEALFRRVPGGGPGEYSRLRARVISRETVARVGRRAGIGDVLRVGRSVATAKHRAENTLIGNAMEAVLGALYLDCGWRTVRKTVLDLFRDEIESVVNTPDRLDPKSALNARCQALGMGTPVYEVLREAGPPHERTFTVAVTIAGRRRGSGSGPSKKAAEQAAASRALATLRGTDGEPGEKDASRRRT